jgi:serine phosphatase RsbU (regulator of sigma subunit)
MKRPPSAAWIKVLLVSGTVLAVALLAQTVLNYELVSTNLIAQQARRMAEDSAHNVERAMRLARPQDDEALRAVLDDIYAETRDQIASIAIVRANGSILAAVGQTPSLFSAEDQQRFLNEREFPLKTDRRDGRDVLAGVFPCRCSVPGQLSDSSNQPAGGRILVAVAIYPDALTASFARLRRTAAISAAAALALLVSNALIAARFGSYVRGKQLEAQMDVARQVQTDLLPSPDSWPADLDIAAHFAPAWEVGGDFYDIVRLAGDRVAFALGDVSGHDVSAALLMSLIKGAMSSPPWGTTDGEPDRGAGRLNDLLLTKSSGERYASLFWCAYDRSSGRLQYLNAGHLPPIWVRRGADDARTVRRLTEGGPVLGLIASAAYHAPIEETREGDLLVLFSDGIVEAANRRDEQFGEERLIAIVERRADEQSRTICEAILSAVREFCEGMPAQDDQTLLVVRLSRGRP